MRVILSAAISSDGYLDDASPERLVLSSAEDWTAVHRLRAECDAILIGAETLRRDNPSLRVKNSDACPVRVVVSGSGRLDPAARFFTAGEGRRIVITSAENTDHLTGAAEIIRADRPITAAYIVTELERRGIVSLMVEGGARILGMFLQSPLVDRFRLAVAPHIRVADRSAPRLCRSADELIASLAAQTTARTDEKLGYMEVTTLSFGGYDARREAEDRAILQRAIQLSRLSPPSPSAYRVGAVVVTADGRRFEGYTHRRSPVDHAEEDAIAQVGDASLAGAAMYCSMEPCSRRASKPESCSRILVRRGFARVVFALYEPDRFVHCSGALDMREAGIEVRCIYDMGEQVREINAHLLDGTDR